MIFSVINMNITVLTENTSKSNKFEAEHGLSLYIETKKHKILFDMGQSDMFTRNALTAGINLSDVDFAVLSHGHYDHGGGMAKFLEINNTAPIYVNKNAFGDYYNANLKYIGLDKELSKNNRIIFTDEITTITQGFTLYSCNEKARPNDKGSFGLSKMVADKYIPDRFLHEQYLLIEESGKKVLIGKERIPGIIGAKAIHLQKREEVFSPLTLFRRNTVFPSKTFTATSCILLTHSLMDSPSLDLMFPSVI